VRDTHVTAIISCIILYWVGSALVEPTMQGFALTLGIGVALSLFSAVIITRTFIRLLVGTNLADKLPLFGLAKPAPTSNPKEQE
jgi:preprotein translocase subunit SecD